MQFILKLSRDSGILRVAIKERYAPQWDSSNFPFDTVTTGLSDEKFIEELVQLVLGRIVETSFDLHINKIDFHSKLNLIENKTGDESHDLCEPDWSNNNYYMLTFDILEKVESFFDKV